MATFFSTDQRGLAGGGGGGDMSFHHHYPMAPSSNPYLQDASTGGLIPLPATIAHIAQDEPAAFMGSRADNGQPADSGSATADLQTQLLMGGDLQTQQRRLHHHHQGGGGGGLSLSLGTQVPGVSLYQQQQYRPGAMASPMSQPAMAMAMAARQQQGSVYVQNSRFLKAARELLDEVVSVRDAIVERKKKTTTTKEEEECDAGSKTTKEQEENSSSGPELSPADRQEVQNKVTALMGMLDQVTEPKLNSRIKIITCVDD